uniref:Uncharacterized protein n=1 Tax=Candidatus Kentrum sp. TC TaxID=2126339 RepID=A0A450ZE23_9GAMM|nr:MAG: hypothetical protein BECKTC1821D_GA0114238_11514 [Candidatus Kentron sp. TC]
MNVVNLEGGNGRGSMIRNTSGCLRNRFHHSRLEVPAPREYALRAMPRYMGGLGISTSRGWDTFRLFLGTLPGNLR